MIHIKAFDPGKATGWAEVVAEKSDKGVIFHKVEVGEADLFEVGDIVKVTPDLVDTVFVGERYTMNAKISQSPWSLEVIGLIRYFAEFHGVPFELVPPASHKNLIGKEVIRRAKLWVPGKPHAMDALSVALWYLVAKRGMNDILRTE